MRNLIGILLMLALVGTSAVAAQELSERDGWVILPTAQNHADLVESVRTATQANQMGVVTEAGPTAMAAQRGITIPENRVIGIFNNDFAVRILALSTAAMIEAPIRIYVTENEDGTATLSYKTPSHVFAPYMDEGGRDLADMAAELDARFAAIAAAATDPSQ